MKKLASNPSLPSSHSKGEVNNTLRPMPPDSNPCLGDPFRQTTNAVAHLTGLKPPDLSHCGSRLCERTEALWLATIREVAFHFSKIGEAIDQYANENERLMQSQQGGEVYKPVDRSPANLHRHPHRDGINAHTQSIGQYPNGNGTLHSEHEQHGVSMEVNKSANQNAQVRSVRQPPIYPNSYVNTQRFQTANDSFGLKRRPAMSVSELDHRNRQPLRVVPVELNENVRTYVHPRFPRAPKRIRINWTEEENTVFFDTIRKYSTKDEQTVLREIVSALGGTRNRVQCKGHFRNLLAVGKITREKGESREWTVHEDMNEKEKQETKESAPLRVQHPETIPTPHDLGTSSAGTANSKLKDAYVSTTKSPKSDDSVNVGKTYANEANGDVKRSASIDQIMNPMPQDEKRTNESAIQKSHTPLNRKHGLPEYDVFRTNESDRANKVYVIPQTARVSGEQHFDASRIRETAIFMSKQAAAKEAYERSNCEPAPEQDIRKF